MNKSEGQLSVVSVTRHEPSKVLQPTDGAFDPPPAAVAAESAPILRAWLYPVCTMWADQMNSAASQALAQRVAVGSAVVKQMPRQTAQSSLFQERLNQGYFVGAGAGDVSAQWQAVRVGQDHDFCSFTAHGLAYAATPLFAEENVPSAIASSAWTLPA